MQNKFELNKGAAVMLAVLMVGAIILLCLSGPFPSPPVRRAQRVQAVNSVARVSITIPATNASFTPLERSPAANP